MSKLSRLGMTLVLFGVAACLAVFVAGCGGGASSATQAPQLLHLRGYDITPDNWRTDIRMEFLNNGASANTLCQQMKGLTLQDVVNLFIAEAAAHPTPPSPRPNSTPVPGQTVNPEDAIIATQIIIDECNRVSP